MASLVFVDKDNEERGSPLASKDGLKLGSGVEALDEKLQVSVPQVGGVFNAPALPKAIRKALGTVNRVIGKLMETNRPLKQKSPTLTVKKVSVGHEEDTHAHASALKITEKPAKTQSSVPASDDTYPETEKFFPFSPLDFESSDLPEEHQIAHLPLNGVPLMILSEESVVEKLLHPDPFRL